MACFYMRTTLATKPITTKTKPTSISRMSMVRNAAPATTELAMLVVILVTLAAGQIAEMPAKAPKTASTTMEKMPANRNPSPAVRVSASPALWTGWPALKLAIFNAARKIGVARCNETHAWMKKNRLLTIRLNISS